VRAPLSLPYERSVSDSTRALDSGVCRRDQSLRRGVAFWTGVALVRHAELFDLMPRAFFPSWIPLFFLDVRAAPSDDSTGYSPRFAATQCMYGTVPIPYFVQPRV